MSLSPARKKVLDIVRASIVQHGYPPTMQEMAEQLSVSKVTVFEHIDLLVKHGYLEREPNKARSLRLTALSSETLPDCARTTATAMAKLREAWSIMNDMAKTLGSVDAAMPARVWLASNRAFAPDDRKPSA